MSSLLDMLDHLSMKVSRLFTRVNAMSFLSTWSLRRWGGNEAFEAPVNKEFGFRREVKVDDIVEEGYV